MDMGLLTATWGSDVTLFDFAWLGAALWLLASARSIVEGKARFSHQDLSPDQLRSAVGFTRGIGVVMIVFWALGRVWPR